MQKGSHGVVGLKEVVEDAAPYAKGLLPPVAALAHRVFQVHPQPEQHVVGIKDVAGERTFARAAQVRGGDRRVGVPAVLFSQESQTHAAIQQTFERLGLRANLRG